MIIQFTGYILSNNNQLDSKHIFISSDNKNIHNMHIKKKYPIYYDTITSHLLVRVRIPKKIIMPEIHSGTEYMITVKPLPYKFTKNSITYSGFSLMLVSIHEHYRI